MQANCLLPSPAIPFQNQGKSAQSLTLHVPSIIVLQRGRICTRIIERQRNEPIGPMPCPRRRTTIAQNHQAIGPQKASIALRLTEGITTDWVIL
jgi:hypothetical protein